MIVKNPEELAEVIKKGRETLNMSQRSLMKKSNVGNATISRLESGDNVNIQADTIFALLNALNMEMQLSVNHS